MPWRLVPTQRGDGDSTRSTWCASQAGCPTLRTLTKLVGEGQHEGGLLQGPFQQGSLVGASPWRLPVRLWDRQMAELPRGVGWTPALVPANAASSIQAGDLAEIYKNTLGD